MFRGALCNPADDSSLPAMFGVNPLGVTFFSVGGGWGTQGNEELRHCSLRVGGPPSPVNPPLRPAATRRLLPLNKIGHAVSAQIK